MESENIVHRDIKPRNFLKDYKGFFLNLYLLIGDA